MASNYNALDTPVRFASTTPTHAEHFARAEACAERLMRTAAPEFAEWINKRLSPQDQAQLFSFCSNALLALRPSDEALFRFREMLTQHREAWYRYVRSNPRELRTEIAREK